jgi:hypothetical protein
VGAKTNFRAVAHDHHLKHDDHLGNCAIGDASPGHKCGFHFVRLCPTEIVWQRDIGRALTYCPTIPRPVVGNPYMNSDTGNSSTGLNGTRYWQLLRQLIALLDTGRCDDLNIEDVILHARGGAIFGFIGGDVPTERLQHFHRR